MSKNGVPFIPNIEPLIAAGINPKTGLPYKFGGNPCHLKDDMLKLFRVVDEQDAVRRYTWYNLPDGLNGELIERILYYKGQAMFFYIEDEGFFFLPYALDGTIDVYGRYTGVTPIAFGNGKTDGDEKPWISGLKRQPVYSIAIDQIEYSDWLDKCVLLHDYSKQISQTVLPRKVLNEPLLNFMSETMPFLRTSLALETGVKGVRVQDADQQASVDNASQQVIDSALTGDMFIPIVGNMEFQELGESGQGRSEDFLLALQSLDNLRLAMYGIDNGGLFQKKTTITDQQAAINGGPVGLVYQDGLIIRQEFCNIVNSIWGLGIWCDVSEPIAGFDRNMDGNPYDQTDAPVDTQSEEDTNDSDV